MLKQIINWRIFLILLGASILSVLAIFPYIVTLQGELLQQVKQPLAIILLVQLLQSSILFAIAIFIGLYLANKVKFSLPLLEARSIQDGKKVLQEITPIAVLLGAFTAICIYAVDYLFTLQGAAINTAQNPAPIWQRLLAAFYGGITEEIVMRLFIMTLFVWLGMKITKQQQPHPITIIIALFLAAIIFGLGHLPITAALTGITPLIIVRAVILNGIAGVIFGWLYWKKGLEAAMISHFTADIFLLVILPLLTT